MNLTVARFYFYLVVITIISWAIAQIVDVNEEASFLAKEHSADYFSTDYVKFEMDENGHLKSKLYVDKLIHYSDDKTTHMKNPLMYFYNETTPPWVVKSQSGILSADGKDLMLNGKAIIDRAAAEGVTPLRINTTNLRVKPEISYAETDDWAELLSLPNQTTGIGMKMTFVQPIHLQLLSEVKGKYEKK